MGYIILVISCLLLLSILIIVFLVKRSNKFKEENQTLEDIINQNAAKYIATEAILNRHVNSLTEYINRSIKIDSEKTKVLEDIIYDEETNDSEKDRAVADLLKSLK